MLKGIAPCISPELLKVLAEMGHAIMVYGFTWKRLFARDMGDTSKTGILPTH